MAVVRLLGPVDVTDAAGQVRVPGSRVRATLLALLGLDAGRVVEAERLLDVAWDGEPPASGLRALRFHISKLRAELGIDGLIVTVGSGYQLDATSDIDSALAARAGGSLSAADAAAALDLWRGDALSGTRPCVVLEREQVRLDELRLALLETSGVDPSPELQQLYDDVLQQHERLNSSTRQSTSNKGEGNLPEQRAVLVGRDDQIEQINDLLDEYRLITLTGVGGVGKTSLALEVARSSEDAYAHGCWLVELGSVLGAEQVTTAVLSSLGIQPQGGTTALDGLCASLAGLHLLVILDNCEHVLHGVVELAERVLDAVPGIRIIATSREGLGLRGEYQLTVPSLETLGPGSHASELFRQRASESGWTAGGGDDNVIEELCSRLDGIPLAIELAAARARSMTITELRDRLGNRFRLLKGARRGVERHQTLQATVSWSYDLLDTDEQMLFDRLCVFTGPFELSAAEQIFGDSGFDDLSIDELLGSLVNKSMLTAGRGAFHLLETMRQFGEDRIDDDVIEHTRNEHCRHYTSFVVEVHDGHLGPDEGAWAQRLETAWPNVSAAFGWALQRGDTSAALTIVANLGHGFVNNRHNIEVCGWAGSAIDLPGAADELHYPSCLGVAATGFLTGGDFERGESLAQRAVAACTDQNVDLDQLALNSLAFALQISGRTDDAIQVVEQMVVAARHPTLQASSLSNLAVWQATSLRYVEASTNAKAALAHALMDVGRSEEALELGLQTGRLLRRQGNLFLAGVSILVCARALEAKNDPTNAALLYGAEGWADRNDPFSLRREVLRARLVEALGESAVAELIERGSAMSVPQALDRAESAAESAVISDLPPAAASQ